MVDPTKVSVGQKLRITGMGAPGFARLGELVTVEAVTVAPQPRIDVTNERGEKAYFALTCGMERLETVE